MTHGITTRTTSIGFNVMRLHYSADPDKDPTTETGRRWLEQAKTGMSDARWRKEFEIDYGALSGQRVFPQFEPSIHVVLIRTRPLRIVRSFRESIGARGGEVLPPAPWLIRNYHKDMTMS